MTAARAPVYWIDIEMYPPAVWPVAGANPDTFGAFRSEACLTETRPFMKLVSHSHNAYESIQQMLVSHKLPLGSKISEQRLAAQLGVSRTPVREAIRRLQEEGFLVQVPSSGTFVATPNRKQLIEMYEIRLALEAAAIGKAIRRMKPSEVRRIAELTEDMRQAIRNFRDSGKPVMQGKPLQQFLTADMAVHQLIMHAAGNETAYKVVNNARLRQRVFGAHSHRRDLRHVSRVLLLHTRLARAIAQRDPKAAKQWLCRHIRSSLRAALAEFDATS